MIRSVAFIGLAALATVGPQASAQQNRPLNQPPPGFTSLFNGKDLSG